MPRGPVGAFRAGAGGRSVARMLRRLLAVLGWCVLGTAVGVALTWVGAQISPESDSGWPLLFVILGPFVGGAVGGWRASRAGWPRVAWVVGGIVTAYVFVAALVALLDRLFPSEGGFYCC